MRAGCGLEVSISGTGRSSPIRSVMLHLRPAAGEIRTSLNVRYPLTRAEAPTIDRKKALTNDRGVNLRMLRPDNSKRPRGPAVGPLGLAGDAAVAVHFGRP